MRPVAGYLVGRVVTHPAELVEPFVGEGLQLLTGERPLGTEPGQLGDVLALSHALGDGLVGQVDERAPIGVEPHHVERELDHVCRLRTLGWSLRPDHLLVTEASGGLEFDDVAGLVGLGQERVTRSTRQVFDGARHLELDVRVAVGAGECRLPCLVRQRAEVHHMQAGEVERLRLHPVTEQGHPLETGRSRRVTGQRLAHLWLRRGGGQLVHQYRHEARLAVRRQPFRGRRGREVENLFERHHAAPSVSNRWCGQQTPPICAMQSQPPSAVHLPAALRARISSALTHTEQTEEVSL